MRKIDVVYNTLTEIFRIFLDGIPLQRCQVVGP